LLTGCNQRLKRGIRGVRGSYEHGRLRREQDQVRAIWEILTAHDHNFHPIPVQLPRACQASYILFGRERTRLVHLTALPAPRLPRPHPAFLTYSPAQHKYTAIVPRWARTVRSYDSMDDCMSYPLACPVRLIPTIPTQSRSLSHTRKVAAYRLRSLSHSTHHVSGHSEKPHDNVRGVEGRMH
jgi:hypothetical protein